MDDQNVVLSPEDAAHELVELCHVRPRIMPRQRSVCVPSYFRGLMPIGGRYTSLVGDAMEAAIEQGPHGLSPHEWFGILPRDISILDRTGDEYKSRSFTRVEQCARADVPLKLIIDQWHWAERFLQITKGILDHKNRWCSRREWFGFFPEGHIQSYYLGQRVLDPAAHRAQLYLGRSPRMERHGLWFNISRSRYGESAPREVDASVHSLEESHLVHVPMVALASAYRWQLIFGTDGCASASVPVERDALPDLVRVRDVPSGKKRRAALAHFVAAHHRRGRSQAPTEDPAIWIRKHLRGERVFRWDGLTCEIRPPAYELEQLARARAGAAE